MDSCHNLLLLSQHHFIEVIDLNAVSAIVTEKVFSVDCSHTDRAYGKLFGRVHLCDDISVQAGLRRLGRLDYGSEML